MANDIISFGAELDPRKLEQGVNRANAKLGQLQRSAGKSSDALGFLKKAAAGWLTYQSIRRVTAYATELFKLGAAANATASRFRTVFGDSTKAVEAFNREFGKISGLSTQQFQDVSARLGAIAQGMGFAQKASSEFAIELVKLSADLASFNDLPVEDVANRIAAALTGERESLKRLGVVITEVEVQQRALRNTGKETVGALTQQDKATASLQIITEKAGVAVGDLGRTSQEIDNVVKQLSAAWKDFNDKLGTFLAQSPIVRDFLAQLRDTIKSVTTILGGEADDIKRAFTLLGVIAGDAFTAAFLKAITVIPQKFAIVNTKLKEKFGFGLPGFELTNFLVDLGIDQLIDSTQDAIGELNAMADAIAENGKRADTARASIQKMLDLVVGFTPQGIPIFGKPGEPAPIRRPPPPTGGLSRRQFEQTATGGGPFGAAFGAAELAQRGARIFAPPEARAVGFFTGINSMMDAIKNTGSAAEEAGKQIGGMKDIWTTGFRGMSIILSDFITGGIQGFDELGDALLRMFQRLALEAAFEKLGGALRLPGFQTGGTVPGPIGQPALAVVHGGEEVIPVSRRNTQGVTVAQNINFNISALDAPSVARLLTQQKGTITAVVAEAINDSDMIRRLITRR